MKIKLSFNDFKIIEENIKKLLTVQDTTFQEKLTKVELSCGIAKGEIYDFNKEKIEKYEELKTKNESFVEKINEVNKKFASRDEAGNILVEKIMGPDNKETEVYVFDDAILEEKEKEMTVLREEWLPILQELQDLQKEIEETKVEVKVDLFKTVDKSRNFNREQLLSFNNLNQDIIYQELKKREAAK